MTDTLSVFHRYLHVAVEGTTSPIHLSTLELTRYRMVCISGSIIELVFEFARSQSWRPGPRSVIDKFLKVNWVKS